MIKFDFKKQNINQNFVISIVKNKIYFEIICNNNIQIQNYIKIKSKIIDFIINIDNIDYNNMF